MALTSHVLALTHEIPTSDSYICSFAYGHNIRPKVCQNLVDTYFPPGDEPLLFSLREPSSSDAVRLPFSVHGTGCTISVESAGPGDAGVEQVSLTPSLLRGAAEYVIQTCPIDHHGIGGFTTLGLARAKAYVAQWGSNSDTGQASEPSEGVFLTIAVYGNSRTVYRPGDTDPIIGGTLTKYAAIESKRKNPSNNIQVAPNDLRYWLHSRTIEMTRGGSLSWWDGLVDDDDTSTEESVTATDDTNMKYLDSAGHHKASAANNNTENNTEPPKDPGNMTYLCDSSLGEAPDPTDCEKLSWSGLKPPDSIETLEPHTPKLYTQGTCTLALSTSSLQTRTISWSHLLAAFYTLLNLCLQNPIASPKGGRAYYGQQDVSSWINGKRDSVGGVSGAEALPGGINATVFRHEEG